MRRTSAALLGLMLLAGCGFFKKNLGLKSGEPGYQEPGTTSIYGDWVLGTAPDSTAFAGASTVELALQPGTFVITASYPGQSPIVLRGTAVLAQEGGVLTLTPSSGTAAGSRGALVMAAGQPLTLIASAAGNTLVFQPPSERAIEPSSVWHKKAKAQQAGTAAPNP